MKNITEIDVIVEFNRIIAEMVALGERDPEPDSPAQARVDARLVELNAQFVALDRVINGQENRQNL
jgi:hypothetical protein